MDSTQVIIRPLLTEKSTRSAHARNTYSFAVNSKASKTDIKSAVEELYKVKVVEVRTMVRKGKPYRTKLGVKHDSPLKRAMVKLAADSKIELF
ncbi:MAG: 50S ribosomal protein L23 [Tepidisphaeraceae bacterium]